MSKTCARSLLSIAASQIVRMYLGDESLAANFLMSKKNTMTVSE